MLTASFLKNTFDVCCLFCIATWKPHWQSLHVGFLPLNESSYGCVPGEFWGYISRLFYKEKTVSAADDRSIVQFNFSLFTLFYKSIKNTNIRYNKSKYVCKLGLSGCEQHGSSVSQLKCIGWILAPKAEMKFIRKNYFAGPASVPEVVLWLLNFNTHHASCPFQTAAVSK